MNMLARLILASFGLTGYIQNVSIPVAAQSPTKSEVKSSGRVVVTPGNVKSDRLGPVEPNNFNVMIESLGIGESITFQMKINNPTKSPMKILGGQNCCYKEGCIAVKGIYPRTIPPGGEETFEVEFKASRFLNVEKSMKVVCDGKFFCASTNTFVIPYQITANIIKLKDPFPKTDQR
jgi:hypothetical protein